MAIPAYYSLIQRGSSGPDVALVQTWLNGIRDSCTWHAALTVDGRFGAKAEKAVREFQLRYGLAEDGLTVPYPGIVRRSGSAGGCVRLVQQKLNAEGERLTTDGKFGTGTAAAVKRYQARHGLTADGTVGKATWEKLFPTA